ncbi:MAG: 1-acyl-sn-glycerol-3-phosphate acyltransferase [Bacteroidetes bacterium]|nr:1-acyl-sn-glycerol-3-phosphate acyltransferase [Bacteroidota bacterium]
MKKTSPIKNKIPFGILGTIFGHIWALWAAIVFISTMLVFMIPFFLFCYFQPDPIKTRRFILYSRTWMAIFLTLVGCPLTVKGRKNFKKGKTYIVLCNHNALIDVPVSSPGIPGGNKTIAKIEMAKIPVFGLLYKTGSVLVDRKNESSRRESFSKMKEVLEMGLHMCIYPEGTRNLTDQPLKSFHDGAFRLALLTKKEIIPSLIFNSRKTMPPGKTFFLLPYRLSMHFLEPVIPLEEDTVETLKQRVFEIMREYYLKYA